jgi:hypothetical protein
MVLYQHHWASNTTYYLSRHPNMPFAAHQLGGLGRSYGLLPFQTIIRNSLKKLKGSEQGTQCQLHVVPFPMGCEIGTPMKAIVAVDKMNWSTLPASKYYYLAAPALFPVSVLSTGAVISSTLIPLPLALPKGKLPRTQNSFLSVVIPVLLFLIMLVFNYPESQIIPIYSSSYVAHDLCSVLSFSC